ncbi:MAG: choice-of-anchor D domain-containing protein [Myxococcales bacterium]|nr:choice-of-anchor D domain-containing protein [Myxococcales bacterium]
MRNRLLAVVVVGSLLTAASAFAQGKISASPTPLKVGGAKVGFTTTPVMLTITNIGAGQLKVKDATLSGPNAAEFKLPGLPGFPVNLAPGVTFTINVSLTPAQMGPRTATLTLGSDDPNLPTLGVPVSGSGGDPAISLDVGTMSFGNVRVGVPSPVNIGTISNTGGADLKVTDIKIAGAHPGDFTVMAMGVPGLVQANSAAKFNVIFKPTLLGNRSAQIVITSDDVNNPTKLVGLIGIGTQSMLSYSPMALAFGTQKIGIAGMPKSVTITNAGSDAANVIAITFGGANGSWFGLAQTPMLPAKVPGMNGTLPINVVANPQALGAGTGIMTIMTDDPKTPKMDVMLTTSGIGGSILVTPNFIDFGPIAINGSSKSMPITMKNVGSDEINVTKFTLAGDNPTAFTVEQEPMTPLPIAAGMSVTFAVLFKPIDEMMMMMPMAMHYRAEIQLTTDDPKKKLIKLPLDGDGALAGIAVAPMMLTFGTVAINSQMPRDFTITNTGDAPLAVTKVTLGGMSAGSYRLDSPGPFMIDGKATQKVAITFSPSSVGPLNATAEVNATGFMPIQITLTGTGVAPVLGVNRPDLVFPDAVPVGLISDSEVVGIKNGGTIPITLTGISSSDPTVFTIDSSLTKFQLPPGAETSFAVTFKPKMTGAHTGVLTVSGVGAMATVKATGIGSLPQVRRPTQPTGCTVGGGGPSGTEWQGFGAAGLLMALGLLLRRRRAR